MMMKNTQFLFGALGILLLGGPAVMLRDSLKSNPDYAVLGRYKMEEEREEREGIEGALEWQRKVKANQETGLVDPNDVIAAREQANRLLRVNAKSRAALSATVWEETGPNNIGGRCRDLVVDRNNPNRLYIGSSGGGLWISNDGGNSWQTRAGGDSASAIAVCAVAQTANGDLYYGTGEGFGAGIPYTNGAQTQLGEGVFKSTDGGASFAQLPATKPANSNNSGDGWAFVNRLIAHPTDSQKLFAATGSGLRITSDGGATWPKPATLNTTAFMADVEVSGDGNRVIAASNNNIYISNDGGATFGSSIMGQNGMPSSGGTGRIDIAIAPSNADVVYACLATSGSALRGVYKSIDGGQNWTTIGNGGSFVFDPLGFQGFWNIAFGVHPTNPDMLFLGGQLDLYRYTPTDLWKPIANWVGNPFFGRLVHADMHGITFNPSNPNTMYVVTDGGFYRTFNCADPDPFFSEKNKSLSVTQCYGVAANTLGHVVYGSQDNGSGMMGKNVNSALEANNLTGGDGMRCAISSLNPNVVFTSTYGGAFNRATDGGVNALSFKNFFDGNVDANQDGDPEGGAIWNAPIYLKEKWSADNTPLSAFLFGTNNGLWLTQGAVGSKAIWFHIAALAGSEVSAITIPKNNPNLVYFGTANGAVYRLALPNVLDSVYRYNDTVLNSGSFNYQASIQRVSIGSFGRYVTDLDASGDGKTLYVTLGNYGNTSYIFKSTKADTASSIAAAGFADFTGSLPKMPVYSVLCLDGNPNRVIIGTELGVWGSESAGNAQWVELNMNGTDASKWHPRAATYEVIETNGFYKPGGGGYVGPVIYTGTHGRGTFRSTTHTTFWPTNAAFVDAQTEALDVYPNPANEQVTLNYTTQLSGRATVRVFTLTGSLLKTEQLNVTAGNNKLPLNIGNLPTGGYVVYLSNGNRKATAKLIKQ